jgi:hypothetical protein
MKTPLRGGLTRRKPSSARLERTPLRSGGRLPARSAKTAKIYREQRIPLTQESLAGNPWCGIRWDGNCTRRADALHEILPRGRGGSITEKANTLPACNYCNGAVSDNPAEAEARGFLLPSGRPAKAVARRGQA